MPKTGRTHQIRVHLASIGHPIVGDGIYGKKQNVRRKEQGVKRKGHPLTSYPLHFTVDRLMLHALSIEFTAQDGKRMRFETGAPKEFAP